MLPRQFKDTRFSGVFYSDVDNTEKFNQVIAELDGNVVVPTLGSIVPNWVLAIPRDHSFNYRDHADKTGQNPFGIVSSLVSCFGVSLADILWFEHGAQFAGSATGCGVDHAHLHLIFAPQFSTSQFRDSVADASSADWKQMPAQTAYCRLQRTNEYYVFGSGSTCFVNDSATNLGSQFFRKRVAELVGKSNRWDYREFPFDENVMMTLQLASSLDKIAA